MVGVMRVVIQKGRVVKVKTAILHLVLDHLPQLFFTLFIERLKAGQVEEGPHGLASPIKGPAVRCRSARAMRHVRIAGGVDKDLARHGLPPRFALYDDGGDGLSLFDHARHQGVQHQLDAGLLAHLIDDQLERLGVETDPPLLQGFIPCRRTAQGVHALGDLAQNAFDDGSIALRPARDAARS